ncbi:MAG: phrB, partial [Gammaproteobacteria bacterium]|nr:phrB [Gammaproteobacteria bacterium]
LYFNKQYEYDELNRDEIAIKLFQSESLEVHDFDDQLILAPGRVLSQAKQAFKVFTPFKRKWWATLDEVDQRLVPLPKKQAKMLIAPSNVPRSLPGFRSAIDESLWPAGERYAHKQLEQFCERGLFDYSVNRDFPAIDGTSRLSPYLAQGVISARQCLKAVLDVLGAKRVQDIFLHQGPSVWLNEFVWREFYKHILYFYPRVSKNLPFKPETQRLAWQNDKGLFKAWCVGNTGFPIVDAAMRQLNATGWMHNRLRMITAMFLTKTLLINWQWGEQYFSEHLIDCDLSANNGGWQWSASTGTDAVPYFRIFNPTTQSQKYDPDGRFIRQYCPELSAFDNKSIHQPYAKQAELAKKSGYPPPIVDYKLNRELAISMFKSL